MRKFIVMNAILAVIVGLSSIPGTLAVDVDILNFALNLEYLEATFYSQGVYGKDITDFGVNVNGIGTEGNVTFPSTSKVTFNTTEVQQLLTEIANDERAHVQFLREALGPAAVARSAIDLSNSFTALARAAGLISDNETFDPYANENNFLLAGFVFEDVGVTAYKGAARLIDSKDYLEAAAGILAVEAYHASGLRLLLFQRGFGNATDAISRVRDQLDGAAQDDQGVTNGDGSLNLIPADSNGLAYSRTVQQVLDVVYASPSGEDGGFFPDGVNGNNPTNSSNETMSTTAKATSSEGSSSTTGATTKSTTKSTTTTRCPSTTRATTQASTKAAVTIACIHSPQSPRCRQSTTKSTTRSTTNSVTKGATTTCRPTTRATTKAATTTVCIHSPQSPRCRQSTTKGSTMVTTTRTVTTACIHSPQSPRCRQKSRRSNRLSKQQ